MQRTPVKDSYSITIEDLDFLDATVKYYRYSIRHEKDCEWLTEEFYQDLKALLRRPANMKIGEVGNLLAKINNTRRLQLLKMRPEIIDDRYDLIALLRHYIPVDDRTLFAAFVVEKLYHERLEILINTMLMIIDLLPAEHQLSFFNFSARVMNKLHTENENAPSFFRALTTSCLLTTLQLACDLGYTQSAIKMIHYCKQRSASFWRGPSINLPCDFLIENAPTPHHIKHPLWAPETNEHPDYQPSPDAKCYWSI